MMLSLAPVLLAGLPVSGFPLGPLPHLTSAPALDAERQAQSELLEQRVLAALPARTLLLVAAWSPADTSSRWQQSSWNAFLHDEQLMLVWNHFGGLLDEFASEMQLPVDPCAMLDSLSGPVAFYAVPSPDLEDAAVGLILGPGEERGDIDTLLGMLDEWGTQSGSVLRDSIEGGHTVVTYRDLGGGGPDAISVTEVGGLISIVAGDGGEWDEELARSVATGLAAGRTGSGLAASTHFHAARATSANRRDVEMYLDLGTLVDKFLEEEGDREAYEIVHALGLDGLSWMHAAGSIGGGEAFDMSFAMGVPQDGLIFEAMPSFFGSAPMQMLDWMPADSVSIGVGNIDLMAIYDFVFDLVLEFAPDEYDEIRAQVDALPVMLGVDIEEDVLGQFTGNMGSFSTLLTEQEQKQVQDMMEDLGLDLSPAALQGNMGSAILIELEDSEEFEAMLEGLLARFGLDFLIEIDEYADHDVYAFEEGEQPLYWTFVEGGMIFSPGFQSPLHAALDLQASENPATIRSNEKFAREFAHAEGAHMFSLADTHASVSGMLTAFSSVGQMFSEMAWLFDLPPEVSQIASGIPWPDAAAADGYFEGTIVSTIRMDNGALVVRTWSR